MNTPVAGRKRKRRKPAVGQVLTARQVCANHLRFGWISLAVFCLLGLVLESLHGFKMEFYLAEEMASRRICWMVAHASGTCLSLVHICFAVTVLQLADWRPSSRQIASYSLYSVSLLRPLGFLLAGWFLRDGKPGMGIGLVLAAVLLLMSVLWGAATHAGSRPSAVR
ncbi:MAG: hypothetical protein ABGX05_00195 [Pirellulaceae bacterium]